jgi:hypothetical protein
MLFVITMPEPVFARLKWKKSWLYHYKSSGYTKRYNPYYHETNLVEFDAIVFNSI